MDENTIKVASKAQLRALCKQNGIQYSKLTNDGMRGALRKLIKPDNFVRERLSDPVVIEVVKKASSPSVLDLLRAVEVGASFSCEDIAKRAGATVASVRTIAQSCNSAAPSNKRLFRLGMRFRLERGQDSGTRTK